MLFYVFIAAAILVGLIIFIDLMSDQVIPLTCPACFAGWSEDFFGQPEAWYLGEGDGRVRCRTCHARFKEHPDGTLHRDPDTR